MFRQMQALFILLLSLTLLYSATVSGKIINGDSNNLEQMDGVLITVEAADGTIFAQKFFDKSYQIDIPKGAYVLRAYYYENSTLVLYAEYDIQIAQDTMDLDAVLIPYELQALVPGFTPPPLLNKPAGNGSQQPTQSIDPMLVIGIIVLAVLIYLLYHRFVLTKIAAPAEKRQRREEKPEVKNADEAEGQAEEKPVRSIQLDDEAKQVLKILGENEGRMLQKEIRDIMNFSETKMSLIIAELEAGGFVKRIKKGRENILKMVK